MHSSSPLHAAHRHHPLVKTNPTPPRATGISSRLKSLSPPPKRVACVMTVASSSHPDTSHRSSGPTRCGRACVEQRDGPRRIGSRWTGIRPTLVPRADAVHRDTRMSSHDGILRLDMCQTLGRLGKNRFCQWCPKPSLVASIRSQTT